MKGKSRCKENSHRRWWFGLGSRGRGGEQWLESGELLEVESIEFMQDVVWEEFRVSFPDYEIIKCTLVSIIFVSGCACGI